MATMKDVARLANVSHGTVSNIINGTKQVSLDKIRRVERAMQELSYKPNAIARNLKLTSTRQIDVILPKISMDSLAKIYTTLTTAANENGYVANLYMTNEDAQFETKLLEQSVMYHRDGVILMTCQPNNGKLFRRLIKDGMNIVFIDREVHTLNHNYVTMDVQELSRRAIDQLLDEGYKDIGFILGPLEYSFEKNCMKGYKKAFNDRDCEMDMTLIASTNYDEESAFKEAIKMLCRPKKPEAIFVTCTQIGNAVEKAMEVLGTEEGQKPLLVVLSSVAWIKETKRNTIHIQLPYGHLAKNAFQLLLDNMAGAEDALGGTEKIQKKILKVKEKLQLFPKDKTPEGPQKKNKTLKVLLTKDYTQDIIRSFIYRFEKETGCKVEIDVKSYPNMFKAIQSQTDDAYYDVLDIDVPWLPELAQSGMITDIEELVKENPEAAEAFPEYILETFSIYEGKMYTLPLTYCGQLLFYRKDYFEDLKTQRLFFSKYKRELAPPKTWEEFNEVARFFTRSYNEYSPTEFGTTVGSCKYSGAVCEYLPRLFGMGGEIFKNGRFCFDSLEAVRALENYKESFSYAPFDSYDNWWEEETLDFRTGKVAMMILFGDNIPSVTERDKSSIIGGIGYEQVPGVKSVLGGWSLAVNAKSKKKELAFQFIKWACSEETAVPKTILGGFVPCKNVIESTEVARIYPWLKKTIEIFESNQNRTMPKKVSGEFVSEALLEEIIGNAVYMAVTGQQKVKDALCKANERLNEEVFNGTVWGENKQMRGDE